MSMDVGDNLKPVRPLKASQPPLVGNTKIARHDPLITWTYYLELLTFVVGVFSFIFAHEPIDDGPVVVLFGGGLAAALLSIPAVWLISRRHSSGAKHFRRLVILGLFTLPMGIFGLGMTTNSLFDTSQPQAHNVIAVDDPAYCTSDKHWVTVQDWRDNGRTFNVELENLALCDATKQGDTLVLSVREGLWGWAWISDVRLFR